MPSAFGITWVQLKTEIWRIANVVYSSNNVKTGGSPMSQNSDVQMPIGSAPSLTTCSNCHSPMPGELRFCRNCGFRLGEGVSEYTETVRFDSARAGMAASGMQMPVPTKRKRRMSGMAWIFVALLVFFIGAAAFTAIITPIRHNIRTVRMTAPAKPKSFVGVDGFDTADDESGVTFNSVEAPDTPADKAGLVGGDIITSWDGTQVRDEDQMAELLTNTPIGKTVDVEYLRDGEKKTTKLTTIAQDEFRRLENSFQKRAEGLGQFGYDRVEQVEIPGTKIHGVRFDRILPNRPADLAGIKQGDIVIKFGDTPIRTPEELSMRVKRALPYSTVTVEVMRGNTGETVAEGAEEGADKGVVQGKPLEKISIPVKIGKQ
ncbi:MAG: hypothetical protein DMF69_05600 [Acidobacteria bacterium]|nr:MAG: hypothetical protein DMF69_05600 [Acidobacteriota bacterium]